MTYEELNTKIKEGSKRMGSKNVYLSSPEYHSLYKQYQKYQSNQTKNKNVSIFWEVDNSGEIGSGIYLKNEKGHYLANTGIQFGMCSGPISFKTKEDAILYAIKNKLQLM